MMHLLIAVGPFFLYLLLFVLVAAYLGYRMEQEKVPKVLLVLKPLVYVCAFLTREKPNSDSAYGAFLFAFIVIIFTFTLPLCLMIYLGDQLATSLGYSQARP